MGIVLIGDLAKLLEMLEEVEADIPDPDDYDGWWCIQHYPVECGSCGNPVCYVEPPHLHLIVVWEEKDDSDMLRMAGRLQQIDLDPIIIQYAPIMGGCIPYEDVKKVR
jgi:hypothetical protein